MAGVALSAVPEALLTVAEKTLSAQQPLLFGLSGPQLSRIAREVYVHLKNSGKEALAQQAQALTDPALLAKALQVLQLQGKHTHNGSVAVCPCCSLGPPGAVIHSAPPQPQVVPVVVQQPLPQSLPLQHPQQQQQQKQQQPSVPAQHQGVPAVLHPLAERLEQQQQQQQQQPSLSRKACVARLLLALVAAKLVKDLLASKRGTSSNSSTSSSKRRGKRKTGGGGGDAGVSGLGGVSVDRLAEPLAPRSGLFAGLPRDLVESLQRVIASAMDGAAAAAGAAGYGPSKEGKTVEGREMPPLYLSPAQQGRVNLTEHEKYASELIDELLRMPGGRSIESIRSDLLKEPQKKPIQQQQQQLQELQQLQLQQPQQQLLVQQGAGDPTETAANDVRGTKQQAQGGPAAQTEDEGVALDKAFHAFVRRAEEHQGPSPLSIEQQLRFYGLYKRATAGPCTAKQPSKFNLKQYKKWVRQEAWKACDAMSAVEAKKEYVERAKQLEKLQARL
ncbi:hypothetical protein ACSSS7_003090 [Eimeria intestinalis]